MGRGMKFFYILLGLLVTGCLPPQCSNENTDFTEVVCKVPALTVHIADKHEYSSHPYMRLYERDKNKFGVSVPVNGYMWVLGYKTDNGVYTDSTRVLGHELEEILHYHCPDVFADPHAKETLAGYFFGEANEKELIKDITGK